MNRILVASALVLGFAGAALAQEAPVHVGNYGPSVADQQAANGAQVVTGGNALDRSFTASIKAPAPVDNAYIVDHSGR